MPLKAGDDLGAGVLIGAYDLPKLFRVKLRRECGRADQVTEEDGELAAFRLGHGGSRRGWDRLGQHRRLAGGQGCRGGYDGSWGRRCSRIPDPDEDFPVLIGREPLAFDQFDGQVFQGGVVELKLPLERAIRQAAALAQQGNRLIYHRDKVHAISSLPSAGPL
jgi:hypothetical protein